MPKKKGFLSELNKNKILFLMLLPTILYFLINNYVPMVGIYYAFVQFDFNSNLFHMDFVGLKNFEFLWKSGKLLELTSNTVLYNIAFILLGNVLSITVAVLLSELKSKWFKKISQSILFLPYFVSFVILSVIVFNVFNYEQGVLNSVLQQLGFNPVDVYSKPAWWIFFIIIFYLWKNFGYSMVIYLAAITGISEEYYEAAKIDGANSFQRAWHITVPMLKTTFIILLLFSLGGIMKGQFDLFYQMVGNNGLLFSTTDILDTYVYRSLRVTFDMGMATGAGVYQSLFGFMLLIVSASLTSNQAILTDGYNLIPKDFSLEGYKVIFEIPDDVLRAYDVTIFVTVVGTALGLLFMTMAGYVLQRKDFKYRNFFAFFIYFTTLFGGGLVPYYMLITNYLKFGNTMYALIWPSLMTPFLIILMRSFINSAVPDEVIESSKIDGANDFIIYARIVLPLAVPGLATIGLFLALHYWNDWFSSALYISDASKYQLQFYLYNIINTSNFLNSIGAGAGVTLSEGVPSETMKMSMAIVVTGPILLLYPFIQRYFVKGLTVGAVKG